jgi:ankyrin repeat protein
MRRLLYLSALEISSLHSACLAGNEERLVQELLSEITDIDRRSVVSPSLLLCLLLCDSSFSLSPLQHDMTALMVAAEKGHLSCLQILLSSSPPADPNLINMVFPPPSC